MAPTLVIAADPYTVYPGGVIAIRCASYLGAARGTLTTETDTRAANSSNTVVRDTQQTATDMSGAGLVTAYAAEDDTLSIDLSTIPELEIHPTNGMQYAAFLSFLTEGEWDATDVSSFPNYSQGTSQTYGFRCAAIGLHGDSEFSLNENDPQFVVEMPKGLSHFATGNFGGVLGIGEVVGDEIIVVRAFSKVGTTIEFLLDQLILLPWVFSGTKLGEWENDDFVAVGGGHNTFSAKYQLDPADENLPDYPRYVDGADGGDINGKFTWNPYQDHLLGDFPDWSGADGGGDYQKKASYAAAEYMVRVVPDDSYWLVHSQTFEEARAHAYSLHGALRFAEQTIVNDDFSRVVASSTQWGWGRGPQGYSYIGTGAFSNGSQLVDGSVAILHLGGTVPAAAGTATAEIAGGNSVAPLLPGARCNMVDLSVSGKFRVDEFAGTPFIGAGTTAKAEAQIVSRVGPSGDGDPIYVVRVDIVNGDWYVVAKWGVNEVVVHGPVDISSWFFPEPLSPWVAFRIEVKRFILRAKVWDASGSEPGAWGYSGFRHKLRSAVLTAYPYGDDLDLVADPGVYPGRHPACYMNGTTYYTQWRTQWDDLKVEYDPYGDLADVGVGIEQPDGGTKVGEITVPGGAWHFVHWGARDWTGESQFDPGYPMYLDFAAKVWNDPAAAELQRSQGVFWYFRTVHENFTLVSMNWREADRSGEATRVLVGGSGR